MAELFLFVPLYFVFFKSEGNKTLSRGAGIVYISGNSDDVIDFPVSGENVNAGFEHVALHSRLAVSKIVFHLLSRNSELSYINPTNG